MAERQEEGQSLPVRREERGMAPYEEWAIESPFRMLRRFHDEMDRMFEGVFGGMPTMRRAEMAPFEMLRSGMPAVDVWEDDENVMVRADLPGVDPNNVEIYATEDNLRLRAETRTEDEERRRGMYRSERRYGRFERMIDLPAGVRPGDAKASFKQGVLEVTLPKTEEERERMRRVPVEVREEQMAGAKGGESEEQKQKKQKEK